MGERAPGAGLTPVTIIGGYLGAGKTTLINQLLAGDHGRRLAVLVNDFGSIAIDEDLISSHDGATISLTNGCVCCSLADSLGDGLDQVLNLQPPVEQIIIEASGVADPGKIAAYGQGWPGCRLDAVLTLVDVETIRQRLDDRFVGRLVARQLHRADLVLLSKCDLVDRVALQQVKPLLSSFTDAPLLELHPTAPPPGFVFDLPQAHAGHPSGCEQTIHASDLFETAEVDCPNPFDRPKLEELLNHWPDSIVRVKGVVALREETTLQVVQRVGRRWSIQQFLGNAESSSNDLALVFIGLRGQFDPAHLAADLASASTVAERESDPANATSSGTDEAASTTGASLPKTCP